MPEGMLLHDAAELINASKLLRFSIYFLRKKQLFFTLLFIQLLCEVMFDNALLVGVISYSSNLIQGHRRRVKRILFRDCELSCAFA